MEKSLIYDLPTRLFHWCFAGLFLAAFFISNVFEEEDTIFTYHMMIGLLLTFIVLLRIIWGVIGSKYARFSSYVLNPIKLIEYIKGIFTGSSKRKLGRNPASSWAALIMFFLSIGLAITGLSMVSGTSGKDLDDVHEFLAESFFIVAILHIAGVIIHTLRHKDPIALSMVTGYKAGIEDGVGEDASISGHRAGVGLVFILLVISFIFFLKVNYNPDQGKLNLFGTELMLGEEGEHHHNDHKVKYDERKHEEDDDHDDDDH